VSDKDPLPAPLPLALPQVLLLLLLLSSSDEHAVTGDSLEEEEIMLWLLDGGLPPDLGGCCGCDCDCCDCRCSKRCW
jgi:hypothetical protein